MTNNDIINMYKRGLSINHIVKCYYLYRTKNDIPNHKFKNQFIITKKSCTLSDAKNYVEKLIFEFASSNKAN